MRGVRDRIAYRISFYLKIYSFFSSMDAPTPAMEPHSVRKYFISPQKLFPRSSMFTKIELISSVRGLIEQFDYGEANLMSR